jgi:hypothetical protein
VHLPPDEDAQADGDGDAVAARAPGGEWDSRELRHDRTAHLAKVMREQLVQRAHAEREARRAAKRARKS